MPHAVLHYSDDLPIDPAQMLQTIETIIASHDAGAGACKGRAYPASHSHHRHLLITLMLLAKPHRDAAFTNALLADIEAQTKALIPVPCSYSLRLDYAPQSYITNQHNP